MIFGHRKCSGGTGYISGHRNGFRAPPDIYMGLMGQEGKHISQQALLRPPYGPNERRRKEGKGEGKGGFSHPLPSLLPSLSFPLRQIRKGAPA